MIAPNEKCIEAQLARLAARMGISAERVEQLHAKYKDWQRRFRQHPIFEQLHAKLTEAWRFLQDPDVSKKDKAIVVAAIGYVLMPLDVIPDWVPIVGLLDDILAVSLALGVVNRHAAETKDDHGEENLAADPADDVTDDANGPAETVTTKN